MTVLFIGASKHSCSKPNSTYPYPKRMEAEEEKEERRGIQLSLKVSHSQMHLTENYFFFFSFPFFFFTWCTKAKNRTGCVERGEWSAARKELFRPSSSSLSFLGFPVPPSSFSFRLELVATFTMRSGLAKEGIRRKPRQQLLLVLLDRRLIYF